MPNPTTKVALLCACFLAFTPAAIAQKGGKAGASYHPPIKIETNPAPFPLGGAISVTGSVFAKSNSGPNPPGLRLRVVAANSSGNYPATGGKTYDYAAIGNQNWAHWSNATFDKVDVPTVAQKLAMIANYVQWSPPLHKYIALTSPGNEGVAIFRKRCIPVNNKSICHWQKQ